MLDLLKPEHIFTEDALNIFTDASIIKLKDNSYIGCIGACLVFGNTKYTEEYYSIINNTTNNNAEIKAIRLGIQNAIRYKKRYRIIRLFSDSQISIFGIRDRIFNWTLRRDGQYYGTSDTPIKNQDIMLEIINTITDNELSIELYHQAGHVSYDKSSLLSAIHVFSASNNIRCDISYELIRILSEYNNRVDMKSREKLHSISISEMQGYTEPIKFDYKNYDSKKYKELVK